MRVTKSRQQKINDAHRKAGLTYKAVWVPEEDARKLDGYAKRLRKAAGKLLPRD
jgi:hypothetical protein